MKRDWDKHCAAQTKTLYFSVNLWLCDCSTHEKKKKNQDRNGKKCQLTLYSLKNFTPNLSTPVRFCWSFTFIFTLHILPHLPFHVFCFFALSLEALAPLEGSLPLGVLAELCLWFTHSVPSGLTGWHKDTKQSWETRAGQEACSSGEIESYITAKKVILD